jgi:glycosyltransferase involved in cell wall biosynthesis
MGRRRAECRITVVICAYTEARWDDTLAAVDSALAQSLPPLEVLLVVDHNLALYTRFTDRLQKTAHVRVLSNSHARGLSGGRNTGVEASEGEIIAFLDDDAVAEPDWLRWFADAFADPQVMGASGLTLPVWASGSRPAWYPREFDWVHGASYLGMPTGRAEVRNVLGGNAAFRRSAFDVAGGFRTDIGRGSAGSSRSGAASAAAGARAGPARLWRRLVGTRPLGAEETELCIRIAQQRPGSAFLFDDRAVIHHRVPAEREGIGYFYARCWAEGLSKAQVAQRVGARDGLFTERTYVTRTLPAGVARATADALRGETAGFQRAGAIATGVLVTAAGYAAGWVHQRRDHDHRQALGRRGQSRERVGRIAAKTAQGPTLERHTKGVEQ